MQSLCQLLDDAKAQSVSFAEGGYGNKPLRGKEGFHPLLIHPLSGIVDTQLHTHAIGLQVKELPLYRNGSLCGELHRIVQQVDQNLGEPDGITHYHRGDAPIPHYCNLQAFFLCEGADGDDGIAYDIQQRDLLFIDDDDLACERREIQNVTNQV